MAIYKPKRKTNDGVEEIKIPYSCIDGTPDLSTKVSTYQNLGQNKDAVYSVVGNVDGTAGTWTGTLDGLTAYYDGLKIYYHIGTTGASTTKLNINGLGAKTVYRYSTTKLGTQYGKNYIIPLVYSTSLNSGCWMVMADYDSTETYTIRSRGRFTTGGVGVFPYSLFAETTAGTVESFTTTSGTGTSKAANTSAKFVIGKPIYYYNYNETIESGNKIRQDYAYIYAPTVDVRYTGNYTDSSFGTYRSVYLNITVDKTTNAYSPTSNLVVSTNGLVSGQYYIYLGYSYSSSAYQFSKINDTAIYYYNGTNLIKTDISNPTKTSELTNDSGFITSSSIPTKLSSFTDDLGSSPVHTHSQYLTQHQSLSGYVPTSRTIAGIDLVDNITVSELKTALSVPATYVSSVNGSSGAITGIATTSDLSAKQDKITSSNKLDYSLIANTPTIGNGTITINQGTTTKGTFTLNQTGDTTITLSSGGGGASEWGDIGGTLSNQTDLQSALDAKANTSALTNVAYTNVDNNFSVKQTVTGGMKVSGRYQGSGDDEGLVVGLASNNYAGVILGDPSGERVVLYNNAGSHTAMVRHHNGTLSYDMKFPDMSGDIVVLSTADYTKLKALLNQIEANPSSSGVTFTAQVNAPTFNGTT